MQCGQIDKLERIEERVKATDQKQFLAFFQKTQAVFIQIDK